MPFRDVRDRELSRKREGTGDKLGYESSGRPTPRSAEADGIGSVALEASDREIVGPEDPKAEALLTPAWLLGHVNQLRVTRELGLYTSAAEVAPAPMNRASSSAIAATEAPVHFELANRRIAGSSSRYSVSSIARAIPSSWSGGIEGERKSP